MVLSILLQQQPGGGGLGFLITVLPIIVIFLFAQKFFIKGITLTGIKG